MKNTARNADAVPDLLPDLDADPVPETDSDPDADPVPDFQFDSQSSILKRRSKCIDSLIKMLWTIEFSASGKISPNGGEQSRIGARLVGPKDFSIIGRRASRE